MRLNPSFVLAVQEVYRAISVLGPDEQPSPRDVRVAAKRLMAMTSTIVEQASSASVKPIDCTAGCDHCCRAVVSIGPVEALALGMHLQRYWDPEALAELGARIDARLVKHEDLTHEDCKDLELPCVLLDCELRTCIEYDWRPIVCRAWHSFDRGKCREEATSPE